MLLRSLLLMTGLLVVLALVASAMAPEEVRRGPTISLTEIPPAPDPAQTITGAFPAQGVLRARVGDVVAVTVRSSDRDVAEVRELGLDVPVGPGVDGQLRFLAGPAGRFVVRARYSGRELGVVVVSPAPVPEAREPRDGADGAEPL